MPNTKRKTKRSRELEPFMPWQEGEYAPTLDLRLRLPMGFLLLCKLLDITPEELLRDMMDNLACGAWKREGREVAKAKLQEYVIAHGYGQAYYAAEDIQTMFNEMDALGSLFPNNGEEKMIDLYTQWRQGHYVYWFDKWFNKNKRK